MNKATQSINEQLQIGQKKPRQWLKVIVLSLIAGVAFYWHFYDSEAKLAPKYTLEKVTTSDIRSTVSATGTLQPTNEVEVGSELSGKIEQVLVDYNDKVKKGQLLAVLDTEKLTAQVLQTKAALQVAQAGVIEADASLEESIAQFNRMKKIRKLSNGKLPSEADFIAAQASEKKAQAAKTTALAKVQQAQANLDQNLTDMSKTKIVSPINGIVLIRSIEVGQTVAATMSAPVLFTLAEDLTQMELQVYVDEADVGLVNAGQHALFTVDAFTNINFPAEIKQVRFGAEASEGVVTYKTLLEVNNAEMKLRPGMTASAEILVKEKLNVTVAPLAAIRFSPAIMKAAEDTSETTIIGSLMPRGPRGPGGPPGARDKSKQKKTTHGEAAPKPPADQPPKVLKTVWRLVNNVPEPIHIEVGETSGDKIEVLSNNLSIGDELITGVEVPLK